MSKRIALMFAGQGAQAPGMGADLFEASAAARAVFKQADASCPRPVSTLCFSGSMEELTLCANCQPAIVTMSLACLAALQERLPLMPVAAAGLSLGELAALTAAGAWSLADGLRLVAERGELMDRACREHPGSMAAVIGEAGEQLAEVCRRHAIDIANLNCPGQSIISGAREAVSAAAAELAAAGLRVAELQVAGAYHSRLMQPAAMAFAAVLRAHPPAPLLFPVAQNYTGALVEGSAGVADNLARQVAGSVRWESCARALMSRADVLVELGPGSVLSGLMRRIDRTFPVCNVNSVDSLEQAVAFLKG